MEMQTLHDYLIFYSFKIDESAIDTSSKHIYLKTESHTPDYARVKNTKISWEKFLKIKKNYIERFNNNINTFLPNKKHFYFHKNETCFWGKLYQMLGFNFFHFVLTSCKLFLLCDQGHFVDVGIVNQNCFKIEVPKLGRKICEQLGYETNLKINVIKMMYNNNLRHKSETIIRKNKPILDEVLHYDVGQRFQYDLKNSGLIKNVRKLERTDLCVSHVRSMLKNSLQSNVTVVPQKIVILLLQKVLTKILPTKIFNNRKHLQNFLKNITKIIENDSIHTVTLGEIMKGVVEGRNKILQNLCAKIVMWIINEVVFNTIKSCFYVTETSKSKALIFVLINKWIEKEKTALEDIISRGHLKKLEIGDTTNLETLTSIKKHESTIRFVPKDSLDSFRPIIQRSSYQKDTDKFARTCNIFLKQLIATEKNSSNNTTQLIHESWKNFIDENNKTNELFFVKTDITDAYGSIVHVKLKDILNKLFDKINSSNLKLIQFECKGYGDRKIICEQFPDLHLTISSNHIRKRSKSRLVSVERMKNYIFNFIDNIFLKFKNSKHTYQYVKGLPQGMKLSAALCEIYYNDFDTAHLKELFNPEKGDIFLRYVDDYFYVSISRSKAAKFIYRLTHHTSDYGFIIQKNKTYTNLLGEKHNTTNIPYFGHLINLEKRTVTPDLSCYRDKKFISNISFNGPIDLDGFRRRLGNLSGVKFNSILLDDTLLSKRIRLTNLYKMGCLLAFRFDAIYEKLETENKKKFTQILKILKDSATILARKILVNRPILQRRTQSLGMIAAKYLILKTCLRILKEKSKYRAFLVRIHAILRVLGRSISATERKRLNFLTKHLPQELRHCVRKKMKQL